MAISIPIISTFSAKGIKQAKAEFQKLEGVGAKTGFILSKAAMGATAAFAGLAAGAVAVGGFLFKAAQAADADRKSQIDLAKTAERFAKANKAQVAALEATVEQMMLATGIADDDLRPSLGRLVRSFKNTDKAARAMQIALDISGRTGKDLGSVVEAMGKAADGSNTALLRLGTGLSKADLKGKSLDEVMALLETRFKGGAADAANTFEGRMERLRVRFGELVERIGSKVLPYFEDLADVVVRVADAFGEGGLRGAIQQLKTELNMGNFWDTSAGEFFKNAYNATKIAYDAVVDYINILTTVSGMQALDWLNKKVFGAQDLIPTMKRMPSFEDRFSTPVPVQGPYLPGQRPTASRLPQGGIVVNVQGGDPNAVVDALRRYSRQNGGISGVRLS